MVLLPQEFKNRMKDMLREEYGAFLAEYEKPHFRGIRLNPLKCGESVLRRALPFPVEPAPFSPLSFYLPGGTEKIGLLPMHHAGAFYSQEPSASGAVTVLAPRPGDTVLDLCAAPGGKSTQIASLLGGRGLLWSNEVVRGRASVLLSNLERCGAANAVVSSCHPEVLCGALAGFFDKVLVDAPCSGEGMFRRDEKAVTEWSPAHVQACAVRQLAILESAAQALKENGILVYSTCTFSPGENEGVVRGFLTRHPDFELLDSGVSFGRPAALPQARRIYPMDGGEGHFIARLRRNSQNRAFPAPYAVPKPAKPDLAQELCGRLYRRPVSRPVQQLGGSLLLLPENLPELRNLGVIRAGILLGEMKTNRVEPAHAAFMAAKPDELNSVVSFSHDSPEIAAFLRGEEIAVPVSLKGYTGVAVDGVMTGFGKCSGGRLKNHYPKGLRSH